MIKASDKDMAALRAGLRQEIEDEIRKEDFRHTFDRHMARKSVKAVTLGCASMIGPGDILVATDNGHSFYEYAEVLSADDATQPGRRWINYDLRQAGTGGHSFHPDELVLIAVPE